MKKLKIFLSLLLILSLISVVGVNSTEASSTILIDNYIKVNSISKKADGKIYINYTLKKDFKTNLGYNVKQSLGFTYKMHSAIKIGSVFVPVNSKKGTYTAILSVPSPNYLGTQSVYAKWGASGQSVLKKIGTVYNVPSSVRGLKRSSHDVTKAEAVGGKIVMDYLPGLTVMIILKGKSATIQTLAKKGTAIATGLIGFNLATGYFKQMPSLSAGQVYYRESAIKTNGEVYHRLLIFANKATYNEFKNSGYKKSVLAIYSTSSISTLKY
ncbi:hypothetical protein [Viridibacillus arvi]|uniref:hypothetical protein n=1 Tax=Viridibacillus arvi TaxID=263475 RepID=UPI0036EA224A